jgi:nicotinamide riboside kinase
MYLEARGPGYDRRTLLKMSRLHRAWQTTKIPAAEPLGILDTDLINYKIWFEEVYGDCPKEIIEAIERESHHRYLVCAPDLEWEPDPLRESPDRLEALFERHITEIQKLNRPYAIVRGLGEQRLYCAIAAFEKLAYQPPV